jgi:hypothetical protein
MEQLCIVIKEDGPCPVGQIELDSRPIGFKSIYFLAKKVYIYSQFDAFFLKKKDSLIIYRGST